MAKSENKNQPTRKSVSGFIEKIEDEQMRRDCRSLVKFMESISGEKPVLWGDAMIGFGRYHYKYDSGREGDFFLIGFAPRKQNLAIYTNCYFEVDDELLQSLGKFRNGKSCLNVKKLDDIKLDALEKILHASMVKLRAKYGSL